MEIGIKVTLDLSDRLHRLAEQLLCGEEDETAMDFAESQTAEASAEALGLIQETEPKPAPSAKSEESRVKSQEPKPEETPKPAPKPEAKPEPRVMPMPEAPAEVAGSNAGMPELDDNALVKMLDDFRIQAVGADWKPTDDPRRRRMAATLRTAVSEIARALGATNGRPMNIPKEKRWEFAEKLQEIGFDQNGEASWRPF